MAKAHSTESWCEEMKVQRKPVVGIWKEFEIGLLVGQRRTKHSTESPSQQVESGRYGYGEQVNPPGDPVVLRSRSKELEMSREEL
jgi:hypothetical protein